MARVLVLEDDPAIRHLIAAVLIASRHEIMQAADGRAGLRVFDANRFDLVVTDMLMPDTDGLAFIRKIREQGSPVKIIAISGGGGAFYKDDVLHAALQLGANAVLPKPFQMHELRDLITAMLANPGRDQVVADRATNRA